MRSYHTTKLLNIKLFVALLIATSLGLFGYRHFTEPATAADLDFSINNTAVVLEVTVPSTVTLSLNPTSGRAFSTQDLSVAVGTSNPTGYTIKMQAASDTLTRTASITDGNSVVSTPTIPPMTTTGSATGYDATSFEAGSSDSDTLNRWGYKLSTATNFMPMTTNELSLGSTNSAGNADTITLNFAAKVDASQPAGTYSTTLVFTAVTNAAL